MTTECTDRSRTERPAAEPRFSFARRRKGKPFRTSGGGAAILLACFITAVVSSKLHQFGDAFRGRAVYNALGQLVAEYSTQIETVKPQVSSLTADHLGSPRVLTNKQGEVVSRRDFMPFGEEIAAMAETHRTPGDKYGVGDGVRQKFTGYERDEETGLDFAEARYYYNNHGRFTAVDPLLASGKSADPQTFNRYAYTMNRPLILTDPTGLQAATNPNQQPLTQAQRDENRRAVEDVNRRAGTFTERELRRFNEARDAASRMVAAPAREGEINACRDALIANFGNADPTAAVQRLTATGGVVAQDESGQIVEGPQNVFNGTTSTFVVGTGETAQTIQQFLNDNPTVSAAHDPETNYIYLDNQFFSGRGELGRAQDIIHEAVVHEANGRRDTEFAPANSQNPRREGSREIHRIIQENCSSIPPVPRNQR